MRVASIHRYPVKGLSPETLGCVALQAKAFFPGDRIFALENGPSGFDPAAPSYRPKTRFLMLMKNARLAELTSHYDPSTHCLRLQHGGREVAQGDVRTAEGRRTIEAYLEAFCAGETKGPVRLIEAPDGFRFTDSIRSGFVSLLNLASVSALEQRLGVPVDPMRFRANLAIEGLEAWQEDHLIGRTIRVGSAELKILKPIDRCEATHVDPLTGFRDLDLMGGLQSVFSRLTCGIYASVRTSGEVAHGDAVTVLE